MGVQREGEEGENADNPVPARAALYWCVNSLLGGASGGPSLGGGGGDPPAVGRRGAAGAGAPYLCNFQSVMFRYTSISWSVVPFCGKYPRMCP